MPVVLKVVSVTGAAFSGITMDQLMCAPLSHTDYQVSEYVIIVCSGHVTCDAEIIGGGGMHNRGMLRRSGCGLIFLYNAYCDPCIGDEPRI